jgi:hypothetical protein
MIGHLEGPGGSCFEGLILRIKTQQYAEGDNIG